MHPFTAELKPRERRRMLRRERRNLKPMPEPLPGRLLYDDRRTKQPKVIAELEAYCQRQMALFDMLRPWRRVAIREHGAGVFG